MKHSVKQYDSFKNIAFQLCLLLNPNENEKKKLCILIVGDVVNRASFFKLCLKCCKIKRRDSRIATLCRSQHCIVYVFIAPSIVAKQEEMITKQKSYFSQISVGLFF